MRYVVVSRTWLLLLSLLRRKLLAEVGCRSASTLLVAKITTDNFRPCGAALIAT